MGSVSKGGEATQSLISFFLIPSQSSPGKLFIDVGKLTFGLVNPGPTGPCSAEIGALVDGRRSLPVLVVVDAMISRLQSQILQGDCCIKVVER